MVKFTAEFEIHSSFGGWSLVYEINGNNKPQVTMRINLKITKNQGTDLENWLINFKVMNFPPLFFLLLPLWPTFLSIFC